MKRTEMAIDQVLSPPGDTLQEILDERGMKQIELAERMGRPREKVNDIIKGREPITVATAFQLEKVLGTPAMFWLNREAQYRKELYAIEEAKKLEFEKPWLAKFPVKDLIRLGYLPHTKDKVSLAAGLLSFFGVASSTQWESTYAELLASLAFRSTRRESLSIHSISVWMRIAEIRSDQHKLPPYSREGFREALKSIRDVAAVHPENYVEQLQALCAGAGVFTVVVPSLAKVPVCGAVRWYHGRPQVLLTDRYKSNDHFWFTFFHEAGHILLHSRKQLFFESTNPEPELSAMEEEANRFAENILFDSDFLQSVRKTDRWTADAIEGLAEKFHLHPGILVGRLQREGIIPYTLFNNYKVRINF